MRLHIRAFNFFDGDSPSKLIRLAALYHIACEFVDNVSSRDRISDYAFYVSEQYYRTLSLAATTILRIIRSPELHPNIDQSLGEQCYFAAIRILKKRVLKNNDLNARVATILSQLWQSQRVFQQEDHSIDSLNVRIRSRGVSSSVIEVDRETKA